MTPAQRSVLAALVVHTDEVPLDTSTISLRLGHVKYWSRDKLTRLEAAGFIERLGKAPNNADCWRATDKGREEIRRTQAYPDPSGPGVPG